MEKAAKPAKKRLRKFRLQASGYCLEVGAHQLTPAEVAAVAEYAESKEEDTDNISGSLEGVLKDYDCYSGNLWQTPAYPILESSNYTLLDGDDNVVFAVEGKTLVPDAGNPKVTWSKENEFQAKSEDDAAPSILFYFEHSKGTSVAWMLQSADTPKQEDFSFEIGKIVAGDETINYVEAVRYKGKKLETDWDYEWVITKSACSGLS